jgi:glycosyltransferase involved in cell wall biosynthesis
MNPHISVCVCTYKRPALLKRLLLELEGQQTQGRFTYSVVVADNDAAQSARPVCSDIESRGKLALTYTSEPRQNIALARNAALSLSTGQYAAFIDDDEFPAPTWLMEMLSACERLGASGVLGPVRPHFDEVPPRWIVKGKFCERPEYPTGRTMPGNECRTGNVLFHRRLLEESDAPPFREEFGTGGEDVDFFVRMTSGGHVFRWCNEGAVFETVPRERWKRSYMLRRALLRGRNTLKLPGSHVSRLGTSLLAIPIYTVMLPLTLPLGQHVFMRYCIRFCDHAGRLLAALGLNPIDARA